MTSDDCVVVRVVYDVSRVIYGATDSHEGDRCGRGERRLRPALASAPDSCCSKFHASEYGTKLYELCGEADSTRLRSIDGKERVAHMVRFEARCVHCRDPYKCGET